MPAEYDSIRSPLSLRAHPSAIWLRQEFPVQRKRTLSLSLSAICPNHSTQRLHSRHGAAVGFAAAATRFHAGCGHGLSIRRGNSVYRAFIDLLRKRVVVESNGRA